MLRPAKRLRLAAVKRPARCDYGPNVMAEMLHALPTGPTQQIALEMPIAKPRPPLAGNARAGEIAEEITMRGDHA